jgi:hypothetical protein
MKGNAFTGPCTIEIPSMTDRTAIVREQASGRKQLSMTVRNRVLIS